MPCLCRVCVHSQLYPVMLAGYVSQEFPSVSSSWLTALKFFALFFVMALNIKGVSLSPPCVRAPLRLCMPLCQPRRDGVCVVDVNRVHHRVPDPVHH